MPLSLASIDNAAWQAARREVTRIVDGLGKPVDRGIRRLVVALRVHGFPTSGSCEGHADRGLEPSVDVTARPSGAEGNREEWVRINLGHQARLTRFLEAFEAVWHTDPERRLVLEPKGVFGGFRLQSAGAAPMGSPSRAAQPEAIAAVLAEMDQFAAYLESVPIDPGVARVVGTLRRHQPRNA